MNTIKKALTLMSFPNSYAVSVRGQLFQNELDWVFLKSGVKPPEALFISYAYKGGNYPAYFLEVSEIFSKAGIKLTDITSGDPAALIANAKALVVGGGNIATFISKMDSLITPSFNPYIAIKNRVDGKVPYIGWNEGSGIISPKYFVPATNAISQGIDGSPFEIVCNYLDSSQTRNAIFGFLVNNPAIIKVICQAEQFMPDGTSVRLEESGGGMIDSATAPFPTVIRFKVVNGVLVAS